MTSPAGAEAAAQMDEAVAAEEVAPSVLQRLCWEPPLGKHYFMVGMIISVIVAAIYPAVGAKGGVLAPEVSSSWVAVWVIFVISGWSLKTQELANAVKYCRLNTCVQVFNLGAIPLGVYALTEALRGSTSIEPSLLTGLVITSCLPTTVSMCVMLTQQSKGNEAAAVFNAASGNVLGVFVTPALIFLLVGEASNIDFATVLLKLALKVLAPLAAGQLIQYCVPGAREWFVDKEHKGLRKKKFIRGRESCMIWICYTTFCETFERGVPMDAGSFFVMFVAIACIYLCAMALIFWLGASKCLRFSRADRVALLFCGTHKTVAMGIPLMNTIFEDDPKLGIYCIPLLIWHPFQLFLGSALSSKIGAWAETTLPPPSYASQAGFASAPMHSHSNADGTPLTQTIGAEGEEMPAQSPVEAALERIGSAPAEVAP